ncbi:alpha-1,6-mannosyl-glycoprotein 2-beta-N-acetylglucosaminyltransferase isoform X1 [Leptopilina heterotoma]|uniref:alpha-1,6-mannosyl-glycoprotein 2-beta-N-acetylglucosaminyltransferase isoform X1 n=1 Tax=Leptopilina heterotoma TaxID=63436 RepID=UPI001CA93CBE|nr:alpha-1,6-mannosyl-glycoprotein 2-beta-N-acetylglucosaminyltransferase isoform X1 [Leptopilina heterotoma]XP_043482450.1 alpha-1,6-mannosyl-glycoprotein 2-beta-N-acetylglucosaminyltransferase isoform X1 [Leptopilina heterotoma]XP_043482451.1 alpha-1,6-mannosyl-glycoprotein 2-beta-N-acetylglucosaminyltransferase isoform X1 [Leptopilina heterotoma]XP_043482452.1 alpha-1,6-mannosyl-glycoprotein 2-beta-N-acetylglucosaminyltransferase isoform X1 [Leptopilina heterotoma]XP_043482453.1 alpha-1,6-ma
MRASSIVGVGKTYRGALSRTLVLVFLATFLWLQIHVINLTTRDWSSQTSSNETLYSLVPQELHRFLKERQNATAITANATLGILTKNEINEIRRHIEKINAEQRVINEEAFGPLASDSPVIVVQVHTRLTYLRHLIVSLAQAKDIEQTLIVFSHDVWDPDINYLVQSVDFCRVMQIFYPHSIQTHPRTFPGEDSHDCPRNIRKEQALLLKCTNAQHPDLYGHYREAKFTQTKHHWWWKANRVFDQLEVLKNHTGMVLFLEEDHYVAEDFLHVLKLMERTSKHSCERCNVLSLGTYLKTYNYYADFSRKHLGINAAMQKELLRGIKKRESPSINLPTTYHNAQSALAAPNWAYHLLPSLYNHYQKAEVTPWISSKHNMGMAFNRVTWNKLRKCASQFCSYDDYNWDWSLQHVAQSCLPPSKGAGTIPRVESGLIAMMMRAPRVFHIGECGVHHKKTNCESTAVIAKVRNVLKSSRNHLYPTKLTLTVAGVAKKTKLKKGNGGWGDIRDHELCLNITLNTDLLLI